MKKSKIKRRLVASAEKQTSIKALLMQPNSWSDWMGGDVPLFGSLRFAALMLREVPTPTLVNLLAPALTEANECFEAQLLAWLDQGYLDPGKTFTFADWLHLQGEMQRDPFAEAARDVLRQLRGSRDAELFASVAERPDFDPLMLLYLFMNAIQHRVVCGAPPQNIDPDGQWLVELEPHGEVDGLGMLYAHLFNRFRAAGHFPCERLPLEFEVITEEERSIYFDEFPHSGTASEIESWQRFAFDQARQVLPEVLGDDSRTWRKRAGLLSKVQRRQKGQEPPAADEAA